jgi:hypothetical protein
MSLDERVKKIESVKRETPREPVLILRMWCPHGKTTHPNNGRIRIIPSNLEDAGKGEDSEEKDKSETTAELLRQYEELMIERRKLPLEEQARLDKQETAEFMEWYVALEKAYAEQLRLHGHPKRNPKDPEEWAAYCAWVESWEREWNKIHGA